MKNNYEVALLKKRIDELEDVRREQEVKIDALSWENEKLWEENAELKAEIEKTEVQNSVLDSLWDENRRRAYIYEELYDKLLEKRDKPDRKEWKAFIVGAIAGIGWMLLFLLLVSPEVISKVF